MKMFRRQSSRSRSRDRNHRDEMDRGRREDDRNRDSHDYHENRRRPDARDRVPDRCQRDYRDRRGDDDWACGPRSGTDNGRGHSGAPRPSGGRQFETRYDSQALQHQSRSEATPSPRLQFETRYDSQGLQHQSRSEAMAVQAVHNSGARRAEPQPR